MRHPVDARVREIAARAKPHRPAYRRLHVTEPEDGCPRFRRRAPWRTGSFPALFRWTIGGRPGIGSGNVRQTTLGLETLSQWRTNGQFVDLSSGYRKALTLVVGTPTQDGKERGKCVISGKHGFEPKSKGFRPGFKSFCHYVIPIPHSHF